MKRDALYLIAGILGILVTAGISFITGSIWTGFFAALLIGLVYLIWLDRKILKNIESTRQKTIIRVLIILLIFTQFFAAYMTYDHSQFTQNNLAITRSSIDEGISRIRTQEVLLETLKHYNSQAEDVNATIASSFREVMGDRLNPNGTVDFTEPGVNTDIHFEYEIISPEKVIIRASAMIGKGRSPDFVNVSSQTGKYQAVATLTLNGIDYEREN